MLYTSVPDSEHLIWIQIRILGSVHWITEPDTALFLSGFQDAQKIFIFIFF
jgi:hypothetical protein